MTRSSKLFRQGHRLSVLISVLAPVLVLACSASALANELWVAPAESPANKEVGNWAVAHLDPLGRRTHFGFHVPDDITAFTKAVVVLIPSATGTLTYNLNISVAKSGESQNAFHQQLLGLTSVVTAGALTEIDVSALIPGSLVVPGGTYVSLTFGTPGTTQVLGMRFVYEGSQNLFGTDTSRAVAGTRSIIRECFLGEIMLSAGTTTLGIPTAGQLLLISQNTALFLLLGTTFGGNGSTTFALPDLRGVAPNKLTYSICDDGIFPSPR